MKKLFPALFLSCITMTTFAAPQIIAHRGATADAPENTLYAIDKALNNHADAIWITLQLSKDNQVVLYRPSDLTTLTDKAGPVSRYTAAELAGADAARDYNQKNNTKINATIPALDTVLSRYPDTFFYLDIKSPDAIPAIFARQLDDVLTRHQAKQRIRVYSTNPDYLTALPDSIPVFESRDTTRNVLAGSLITHTCDISTQAQPRWYGFELHRKIEVVETFTLGEARSPAILTWDKTAADCFRKNGKNSIILFGIKTPADLALATELSADGVMVDSLLNLK
ncbi:glycerophosphodiester phosphodiesterase family protein [Morganella psychrotolerans]|nr:glycerophosphodiester phosphodiesterase family protein [Morganella psychrotolerans]